MPPSVSRSGFVSNHHEVDFSKLKHISNIFCEYFELTDFTNILFTLELLFLTKNISKREK